MTIDLSLVSTLFAVVFALSAGAADGAPMRLAHPGGIGFLRAAVVSGIGKVLQWVGLIAGQHIIIAQTAAFSPTAATEDKVCWEDALAEFQMTAGEEYWFVAYFTEDGWQLNIDALGMEKSSAFDVNFIGSTAANALTELPATLPTLTFETLAFYVAAK